MQSPVWNWRTTLSHRGQPRKCRKMWCLPKFHPEDRHKPVGEWAKFRWGAMNFLPNFKDVSFLASLRENELKADNCKSSYKPSQEIPPTNTATLKWTWFWHLKQHRKQLLLLTTYDSIFWTTVHEVSSQTVATRYMGENVTLTLEVYKLLSKHITGESVVCISLEQNNSKRFTSFCIHWSWLRLWPLRLW